MAEYIDKAEALKTQYRIGRAGTTQFSRIVDAKDIEDIPPADVVPVVHAHWEYTDAYPNWVCCSYCHNRFLPNMEWIKLYDIPTYYCPNCGAEMDEI